LHALACVILCTKLQGHTPSLRVAVDHPVIVCQVPFLNVVGVQRLVRGQPDVVLFYKHDVKYLPTIEMRNGMTMEKSFSFTKGYKV
jgi:hypothetical protein